MNASTPVRCLIAAIAGAVAATVAHAQNFVIVNKELRFTQTGPATVVPNSQGAARFNASVEGTATNPAPPNTVTIPSGGGTRTLVFAGDEWNFEQTFATQAALNTAFPNGTYQMTFGGRNVNVALNGDLYPAAPTATLSQGAFTNGTLTVDRAQPLTITISFPQNYLAGSSRLGINVFGQGLDTGAGNDSSNFTQTPFSFTLPANTLAPGGNYTIELEANRILSIDTTSAAGFAVVGAYSAFTTISVSVGGGASGPPTITSHPSSATVAANSTVILTATATGGTSFQWRRDGVNIQGATGSALILGGANVIGGSYTLVATNASGSATSNPAVLTVSNTTDVGKLINLSILTSIGSAGDNFTLGYVVGGTGTSGAKPLVIRAAGPSLGALGVPGTLADPRMELFAGSTSTQVNDNWGGVAAVTTAMASVGAFPYTSPTSLDAAVVANITTRDNSVKVNANGTGTGQVIAEVYDATAAGTFTAATPRLLNVSVLKNISAGGSMTAGFVLRGQTSRTVLIRAIGPGLGAAFGIPGFMPDPQLTLFGAGGATVASNDNWNGSGPVTFAANAVGAFAVTDGASRDAMLVMTLPPGDYSARVSAGGAGAAGGQVIIEVYEVP